MDWYVSPLQCSLGPGMVYYYSGEGTTLQRECTAVSFSNKVVDFSFKHSNDIVSIVSK